MSGSRGRPSRTSGASGAVAMVLVVLVAVGVWLLNGRDPGTSTAEPDPTTSGTSSSSAAAPADGVLLADLPAQARETVRLIDAGGPFPEDEDGAVFGNYEGLLPAHERGYYREYTVRTPGEPTRGARRIVAGDDGELWWTADHYASFERITR